MLLGLCGYAGVGKDVAAQVLLNDLQFQRIAFADPIKGALLALDPLVPTDDGSAVVNLSEYCEGKEWAQTKESPEVRRLMQLMGTEVGRNLFDADIWVKLAERKLESTLSVGDAVFTDVRFPNEARLIKKYGGFLIRIERPGFTAVNEHVSDRASESWSYDLVLENDGDIASLHSKMKLLIEKLRAAESRGQA